MSASRPLEAGSLVGGRYRILRPLGQGGMAMVFLAHDEQVGEEVALKIMRPEYADDPDFVRRFATEARAAASLDHPNIVRVLDYGQDEEIRYIVQEYIEGQTLKDLIAAHGALDYHLATPLAIQIALALEHAHQRDVIHRDIKPQNILITNDMVAKVTDFGIARAANANTITLTGGVVMGSVHYFSPEQARGGQITARSDLYSLGIVFYEMLTGHLPFDGESSVAVAIKHLQEMPPPPTHYRPKLPVALDHILARAIAKNPDVRYLTAREFVNELDAFMVDPNGVYGIIPRNGTSFEGAAALGPDKAVSDFGKIREIEHSYRQRRGSRYRDTAIVIGVVAIAVVLLSIIAVSLFQRFGGQTPDTDPKEITLPNFVTRKYDTDDVLLALEQLEEYGVRIKKTWQFSESIMPGVIFKQIPESDGTVRIKTSGSLELFIARGRDVVAVPNVAGQSKALAEQALRTVELSPHFHYERHDTVARDKVIRTEPKAGTQINIGDPVDIYVSSGQGVIRMPSLNGRSYSEAETALRQLGLALGEVRYIGGQVIALDQCVILSQNIQPDTEVEIGTVVPVLVGTAQDYYYYHNPTPVEARPIQMPNFVGTRSADAQKSLSSAGFSGRISMRPLLAVTIAFDDPMAVIAAQEPSPNTVVAADSTIVFYFGTEEDYQNYLNPTPLPTPSPPPTEAPTEPTEETETESETTAEVIEAAEGD